MPWESPAPALCCAPWVYLWQSRRWARGGDRPAVVTPLGMGAMACPALVPLPPPSLVLFAASLEAGCAAGVSWQPSQGCPQEGKCRHLFCLFFHNSVCGLIEMLHRAAALEQVLLVSVSRARLALWFLLTSAGLEVPKS